MAEPQSISHKIGLTRGKAVLVGVLAAALVGVAYIQYGSTDEGSAIAVLDDEPVPPPMPEVTAQALPAPPAAVETQIRALEPERPDTQPAVAASFDESKWKAPELTMVVAYDPFALPSAFPQPVQAAVDLQSIGGAEEDTSPEEKAAQLAEAIESLQTELKALQERGVQVIFRRGRDGYVAMIGDRTIHVGDEIEGFTVTAIEPDGVRVERKLGP